MPYVLIIHEVAAYPAWKLSLTTQQPSESVPGNQLSAPAIRPRREHRRSLLSVVLAGPCPPLLRVHGAGRDQEKSRRHRATLYLFQEIERGVL